MQAGRAAMIGENVSEQHEKARADLEASVAQFLTNGGEIQDCGVAASVPRRPSFRWYPDQPAQDKQVVQVQRSPQLLGQAIQAAKTMTVDEASVYLGASRAQLLTLSRKHSFCFRADAKQKLERELRRRNRAKAQDSLVEDPRLRPHRPQPRRGRQAYRHQPAAPDQARRRTRYRLPQVTPAQIKRILNRARLDRCPRYIYLPSSAIIANIFRSTESCKNSTTILSPVECWRGQQSSKAQTNAL